MRIGVPLKISNEQELSKDQVPECYANRNVHTYDIVLHSIVFANIGTTKKPDYFFSTEHILDRFGDDAKISSVDMLFAKVKETLTERVMESCATKGYLLGLDLSIHPVYFKDAQHGIITATGNVLYEKKLMPKVDAHVHTTYL